ncbi:MAG: bifunctional diaminohydroxyphosphoribosylaminopyrimidine deaminase/5-amino-6-(5-phosphoribosylamino)uracil reductase RibD [Lentisphaeria bacterium]|nr:bifunctional diaminohydroxyphosphoribosylaminopyrimidine deaminase/5-amino-6-(5-phosphoribosylamino)uracil reductase RibD [Lentisphaeria bacterium]
MTPESNLDKDLMGQCIALALSAFGSTSPNPLVGALLYSDDEIIAKGWHAKAGEKHAEIVAIESCKNPKGSCLYVTLEPCSSHGRTGPCTDAIINAGIKRVVMGSLDPNPEHSGQAVAILEAAGIDVSHGVLKKECQALNEAFNCWIRYNRPYVKLKMAMTLDGKIATKDGQSQWISGTAARDEVQKMRQWSDAILIGAETLKQDDPSLLVRNPETWQRQPLRLIASRSGNLDKNAKVFTDGKSKTEIIDCQTKEDWQTKLKELGENDITALLIEGGGELSAALLNMGLVDKVCFFIAPKILGGKNSRAVIGGADPGALSDAFDLKETTVRQIGEDFLIEGYITDVHRVD